MMATQPISARPNDRCVGILVAQHCLLLESCMNQWPSLQARKVVYSRSWDLLGIPEVMDNHCLCLPHIAERTSRTMSRTNGDCHVCIVLAVVVCQIDNRIVCL